MSAERPNVLVILCDQLRRDLLGAYGNTLVRTPHLDALAVDGIVFDHMYTPTGICSPARASLQTGVYPHVHHMFNNSTGRYSYCQRLRPDVTTLADWADEHTSYETAYYGKWHIGPPEDLLASRFHHKDRHRGHPSKRLGPMVTSVADGHAGTLDVPIEDFPDGATAKSTTEFLHARDRSRPFLAFCALPGPHAPWLIPHEFGIRYDAKEIPMWANRNDTLEGKPFGQKKLHLIDVARHPYAQDDDLLREMLAVNFSYIELIDTLVGGLVKTLKELGEYDRTAIFFTTDHGDPAGSHGFIHKGAHMYDELYHTPLLFKPAWPSPTKPARVAEPVHLMDVTATALHLMSGEEQRSMGEQALHGVSIQPFAEGTAKWERQVHYAQYHGDWYGHVSLRMVTDGRWKLVWCLNDLGELYDLTSDPHELTNRYYDPACVEVRRKYIGILLAEAERLGDNQLGSYAPVIASVEDELALQIGRNDR